MSGPSPTPVERVIRSMIQAAVQATAPPESTCLVHEEYVETVLTAAFASLNVAAQPSRIVLWSKGISPNWYFIAEKSHRPNINDMPVYETLDPIINAGTSQAIMAELIKSAEEVLRISDRDHEAWHRLRIAILEARRAGYDL